MIAASNGHLEILEALLNRAQALGIPNDRLINKDSENSQGMTPLHAACLSGNIRIVDLLLDRGADFMHKDKVSF